jgi:hypothetical protein
VIDISTQSVCTKERETHQKQNSTDEKFVIPQSSYIITLLLLRILGAWSYRSLFFSIPPCVLNFNENMQP